MTLGFLVGLDVESLDIATMIPADGGTGRAKGKPDLAVGTSAEMGPIIGRRAAEASRYGGAVEDDPQHFEKGELNAFLNRPDDRPVVAELVANLKRDHDVLARLLQRYSGDDYEDTVYRFYHQSFKVYFFAQGATVQMVEALRRLSPTGGPLHPWFEDIVAAGTGRTFQPEDNRHWLEVTRPMLEAYWHARYFVEMAVRYGAELDVAPSVMPYGWAALLYLYNLR
jgi:hypothetical protein